LDGGGVAATQDSWQAEQAPAPANQAVQAPAEQPELSGYEDWGPSVGDGTTATGYGAEGSYSEPYDAGSAYEEAPAQSYPYDDAGASSWPPAQEVAPQEVPSGTETYDGAGTAPVGTADTLGDTGTSDASLGGGSTWQTSPDLSAWGDDGSGGSFQEEAAPVVSAPADTGSGGSLDSGAPVEQTSAPSGGDLSSGGGSDLSSGGGSGSENGGNDAGEGG
ncbi:MAG: hypothetical protein M3Q60_15605, partial [Actinomycetota bacterium]|nr:hypothetical protein [Actinomycetota bacterium]